MRPFLPRGHKIALVHPFALFIAPSQKTPPTALSHSPPPTSECGGFPFTYRMYTSRAYVVLFSELYRLYLFSLPGISNQVPRPSVPSLIFLSDIGLLCPVILKFSSTFSPPFSCRFGTHRGSRRLCVPVHHFFSSDLFRFWPDFLCPSSDSFLMILFLSTRHTGSSRGLFLLFPDSFPRSPFFIPAPEPPDCIPPLLQEIPPTVFSSLWLR